MADALDDIVTLRGDDPQQEVVLVSIDPDDPSSIERGVAAVRKAWPDMADYPDDKIREALLGSRRTFRAVRWRVLPAAGDDH